MLCTVCHRQVPRTDARCRSCGTPRDGAVHLDLVLGGGERVPLDRSLALGRAPASDLVLDDPSVSRAHAEIVVDQDGAILQDVGSSYGTFVDGRQLSGPVTLSDGMRIELGDCRLEVSERLDRAAAGMTVSVPAGISLIIEQPSVRRARLRGQQNRKPKLRSGWSLKRLEESEAVGGARFVLKDHRSSAMVRLAGEEAEMAQLLDGDHDLVSLPTGPRASRGCSRNWPTRTCSRESRPMGGARSRCPGWPGSSGLGSGSCRACPRRWRPYIAVAAGCCSARLPSVCWR
jgi:hypothetical protein